jgi:hypothetical protein
MPCHYQSAAVARTFDFVAKATLIARLELPFWLFIVSTIGVPLLVERTPQVDVASRRHQEIKQKRVSVSYPHSVNVRG